MSVPAFFVYDYYMAEKLKQLQRDEPDTWRTAEIADVEQAFARAGMAGVEGAYQHFVSVGAKEGIDPNPLFCAEAYYVFRAAKEGWHPVDVTPMRKAQEKQRILRDYGSAWAEYSAAGMLEYTNASNNFHTKSYITAKLEQLRLTDPVNWGVKTEDDLVKHLHSLGLNPVQHYYQYGVAEGIPVTVVPESWRVYLEGNLAWESRESLLRNKVFQLTEWSAINNINLPKYIDVLLQVTPACIDDERAGYGIQFNDGLVDLKTGTVTEFLLHPRAMQIGTVPLKSFTRTQYNTILDFSFFVEGRYVGFWTSLCRAAYRPLLYAEPYFPRIEDMEYMFGSGPDGDRTFFYALNWGQAEMFDTTKNRLIAIYTDGFKNCYWCKPMKITVMDDPRLIRVDVRDPLPQIELQRIDLITEYMYSHAKVDETPISFITNTIIVAALEIQEDIDYTYDPWLELPPAYPDIMAEVGPGVPGEDITAPILVSTTPGNGATNVNTLTTIILTFSENVRAGTGAFTFSGPDGSETYSATSPYVVFSARSVVITLRNELKPLADYALYGDALCVSDISGNLWAGNITDPIKFQTAQENIIDVEPPKLVSSAPANGDTGVSPYTDVELIFDENVLAGSGYIVLSTDDNDGDGYADHSVTLTAAEARITDNTAALTPSEALHRNTEYYMTITGTAFKDSWGNFYEGISDISTIRFKTGNPALIWYVPDIDRGRASEDFALLQQTYGARMRWIEWWPMDNWSNNWSEVTEAAADGQSRDLYVGAGMGGFYAARLAASKIGQAYLINPVINPATQLAHTTGIHTNHDGTQYNLTASILGTYGEAADPRQGNMRNRFNLCVAIGDEVIDYAVAESYYPKYREYWEELIFGGRWVTEGWSNIQRRLPGSTHLVADQLSINTIVADIRSLGF